MVNNKLLYIVPSLKFFSEGYRGRVMHALGICEGFNSDLWDVTIIGGNGVKKFESELPEGVKFIEIEEPKGFFKYPIWWLKLISIYIKLIKNNNYTCIMTRYVVSSFLPIFIFSILSGKKSYKVVEVNSFAYHMLSKLPQSINMLLARVEMMLMNCYELVYVVSDSMVNDPRNKGCTSKIVCIPNGATTKKVEFFQTNNNETLNTRLVYFGTLMPYWNFEYLSNAINQLHESKNIEVVFLGDGPMFDYLKSNLKRKELCKFHGRFGRNELGKLLNKEHDILLLPPKTAEDMILSGGLSTKLFDYLSMEMPIIAPKDGEITNVLQDGINATLYDSASISDFVDNFNVISENRKQRNIISKAAYYDFKSKYSWSARMKSIIGEIK
ncbi:hypothetical protein A143_09690 [Vibrio splendidus ZS-139]|nr:hypothetical protein A143_09690 [Vibrio splendidus ZS-139]